MNQLDVLVIGSLERAEDGTILEANSTSTLIRAGGKLIVVDTSSRLMRPGIKTSFKQLGVFMKDVDTVILTHGHSDHTANNDLFPNAEIIMHAGEDDCKIEGAEKIDGDVSIAKGVDLVYTPGHTWDSMSVFVEGEDRRYAIVGDAIPLEDNYRKMVPPGIHVCKDVSMKSIKTICDYADVIIPGHGKPFAAGR